MSTLYSPLDGSNNEIRLLTIQPEDPTNPGLHCRLHAVRLDDSLKFNALSYVWGEETPTRSITINNECVDIRLNLYLALCRIRNLTEGLDLWCDAICINQSDMDERSQEVLRMNDIYATAERVLIWLGEEEQRSDLAMNNIRQWDDHFVELMHDSNVSLPELPTQMFDPAAWAATRHLLARPWWRRIWVLQEVAVSRSALLICGPDHCEWTSFVAARVIWSKLTNPTYFGSLTQSQTEMILSIPTDVGWTMAQLQMGMFRNENTGILGLLRGTYTFLATDPRDHLYALFGMKEIVDIKTQPNYRSSISQVYTDFARAFVNQKHRLSFLGAAGMGMFKPDSSITFPSWVPDLSNFAMINDYHLFDAAGQTDADVVFLPDTQLLSTQGILINTVEKVEPREPLDVLGRTTWVDLVLSQRRAFYPTGIPYLQAYFRTLICDYSREALCPGDFSDDLAAEKFYDLAIGFLFVLGSLLPPRSKLKRGRSEISQEQSDKLAKFNDYVKVFAGWLTEIPDPLSEAAVLEPFLGPPESTFRLEWPEFCTDKSGHDSLALFGEVTGHNCRKRSFFITEDGYMGLAPPETMKDDQICVLPGCEVPLVVRKRNQRHLIVGPCYIYGIMFGEAMDGLETGKYCFQQLEFV
jgi:hypothetical protein